MIFNSIPFVLFFIVVFIVYWFPLKRTTKGQNFFLLLSSWFFYGYADWKMLPLLVIATVVFFYLGKAIAAARTEKQAFWFTLTGIVLGIGTLLYFKYFNFFIDSFALLFSACGLKSNLHTFNIIMPLGISFFTFRLLSYVIDIRRGHFSPTEDFIAFAAYISFFPCILSGPIDRPRFIKQLQANRSFDYILAIDGCRQILWGLFKKVVVADNCAGYVDHVWSSIGTQSGSSLVLAAILYLFQIYADFSGYSDMAIGVGKLLGFKITPNFKYPLFALNIAQFWRRWHISLTQWLTDYVFLPLNIRFRDLGNLGVILAVIINFILVGLWHGANWTFAVFGLYHGLLFIPLILTGAFNKKGKIKTNKLGLPVWKDFGRMVMTSCLVILGLIVFRAEALSQAWSFLCGICSKSLLSFPFFFVGTKKCLFFVVVMMVAEWLFRNKEHCLQFGEEYPEWVPALVSFIVVLVVLEFSAHSQSFIYFRF